MTEQPTYTAFAGEKSIVSGALDAVLPVLKAGFARDRGVMYLVFEDQSGRQVDFDLRAAGAPPASHTGPGRPKLGVVAREVTLLPRHWEWLEEQPGGASAALRRLVDQARKTEPEKQRARRAAEAAGRFLTAMAGNLPGYEEATRALYRGDGARFDELIRKWPRDIRAYARRLAEEAFVG